MRRDSIVNNPHVMVIDKRRVCYNGLGAFTASLVFCVTYFFENEVRSDSEGETDRY